jgi:hypothetical protein
LLDKVDGVSAVSATTEGEDAMPALSELGHEAMLGSGRPSASRVKPHDVVLSPLGSD